MRQILHVSHAAAFCAFGAAAVKTIDANPEVREYREFHDRIWSGEISLAGRETKWEYARVHLKQALKEMRAAI